MCWLLLLLFFPCKSVFLFHEQKLHVIVSSLQSLHISSSVTLINYSYHLIKLSSDDLFQCESTNSMTECFLYPSSNILAFLLFHNPWTPCQKMYFHCSFLCLTVPLAQLNSLQSCGLEICQNSVGHPTGSNILQNSWAKTFCVLNFDIS